MIEMQPQTNYIFVDGERSKPLPMYGTTDVQHRNECLLNLSDKGMTARDIWPWITKAGHTFSHINSLSGIISTARHKREGDEVAEKIDAKDTNTPQGMFDRAVDEVLLRLHELREKHKEAEDKLIRETIREMAGDMDKNMWLVNNLRKMLEGAQ